MRPWPCGTVLLLAGALGAGCEDRAGDDTPAPVSFTAAAPPAASAAPPSPDTGQAPSTSGLAPTAPPPAPVFRFVDEAAARGLTIAGVSGTKPRRYAIEFLGQGAALFDPDRDGDLDAYVASGSILGADPNDPGGPHGRFYRNDGSGHFADETAPAGAVAGGFAFGAYAADVDGDGWEDLYLTRYGPNVLFRNRTDGTFARDPDAGGAAGDGSWSTGAAFGDPDLDGDLDLYVANYFEHRADFVHSRKHPCLFAGKPVVCGPRGGRPERDFYFRNDGEGRFVEAASGTGLLEVKPSYGLGVLFSDLDGDGHPDLYVANDSVANFLFWGGGDGTFVEDALVAGVALGERGDAQAGMGVGCADFDGDLDLDLFVTNFSHDYNALYENLGQRFFSDVSFPSGLGIPSFFDLGWGCALEDFDQDGLIDAFVANGHVYPNVGDIQSDTTFEQRNRAFRGAGEGKFEDVTERAGPALETAGTNRGVAAGDVDNDGDVDLLVVRLDQPPLLLLNETPSQGASLQVLLEQDGPNPAAVGAVVEVDAGGRRQIREVRRGESYVSEGDPRLHFGLGAAKRVDRLVVRWPDGTTEIHENLAAGRLWKVRRGEDIEEVRRYGSDTRDG